MRRMKTKYLFSLVLVTVMYFTLAVLLSPAAQSFAGTGV
jgi:hypothetical protein